MNIVTPPLIIEDEDPFKRDCLGRENFGHSLSNLVSHSKEKLVISLDGKWGEGKTTFVKMWQGMLTKKEIHSIYIDAFANDYIDDAFIAVASAITTYIEENSEKTNEEKLREFREKAKHVGVQLLSWTAKVGIKAATLGVIKESNIEELKNIKEDMANGLSTVVDDYVSEKLASHKQDVEQLESFKKLLSKMPALLNNNNSDKPLVIIIDELDRCKPSYAVELIEKIKHLFSVENVIFVLVMHKKQLEEAIKCIYGENIDAHTYLQKFINIETTIPKEINKYQPKDIQKYNKKLFELHQIKAGGKEPLLLDSLNLLVKHLDLSLRQLEMVYTNLVIFYASSTSLQANPPPIVSFLAVIKVVRPSIYEKIVNQKISCEELLKQTEISENTPRNLAAWLRFSLMTNPQMEQAKQSGESLGKIPEQLIREYYNFQKEIIPSCVEKLNMFSFVV